MKNYRLIVFDWDGTLMDSIGTIVRCMRHAFVSAGLPLLPEARYRSIIGLGLREALLALSPELSEEKHAAVTAHYRDCFLSVDPEEMPFFSNAEDVLKALHARGFHLAVATGKARRGLDKLFAQHQISKVFVSSRCADESISKPAPDMLHEIMEELRFTPAETLMVGDSVFDIQMAVAAGVDALGITHGVNNREELCGQGALACLDCLEDLPAWLERPQSLRGCA